VNSARGTARAAGIWFILTFVFSIPAALILYTPILDDMNYVVGGGADTRIYLGAFLEILTAIAGVATAVVLFPILRRQRESVALGYVSLRTVESTIIVVGVISLLSVITLRLDFAEAGGDGALYVGLGKSLIAFHDATFLIGPAFCAGLGNGILLGYLMYASGLVPRGWAILGMIGGTMAFLTATAVLFGAYEQTDPINALFTLPEIVWEAFLGIYMTFWGFKPSPILDDHRSAAQSTAP
jgi:hypothetical protein